jgi:hypothetical protein
MLTKTQLQAEDQKLKTKLQEFQEQLNECKEVTIETASVGDTLEDGSIVLQKSNGLALLVAPKSTEVEAKWSKEFSEVFEALKSRGFNPSQWFIPTKEQLILAYKTIPNKFSSSYYWSSTEADATFACGVDFLNDAASYSSRANSFCVRAFRCVTYVVFKYGTSSLSFDGNGDAISINASSAWNFSGGPHTIE